MSNTKFIQSPAEVEENWQTSKYIVRSHNAYRTEHTN